MKHLVLLGDGPSHLRLLRELVRVPLPDTRVSWVVPDGRHVAARMLPAWVAGRCGADELTLPLGPLARAAGVELIEGEVMMLEASLREVTLCSGRTLVFDSLSVCAHAVCDRDAIRGAREHALFVRPMRHFVRLWGGLQALAAEQALNLVVVGGGAMAVEMALAVQQGLGKRVRVALVTHGGPPMAGSPRGLQRKVRELLQRGQVALFEDRCEALSNRQMLLGQGMRLACDAPLLALAEAAPPWLGGSDLRLDEHGMILTGDAWQSVSHPQVLAEGVGAGRLARAAPRARGGEWYGWGGSSTLGRRLRRVLAGAAPGPAGRPRGAYALACGDGTALAGLGPFSARGRWVGWLKERADRRSLDGCRSEPPAQPAVAVRVAGDEHGL